MIDKRRVKTILKKSGFVYIVASDAKLKDMSFAGQTITYVDASTIRDVPQSTMIVLSDGTFDLGTISTPIVRKASLIGQGSGRTIINANISGNPSEIISIEGSQNRPIVSDANFTSYIAGQTSIVTSQDFSPHLVAGQKFSVHTNRIFNQIRDVYTFGQDCEVDSISGNAIQLVEPLKYDFDNVGTKRRIYTYTTLNNIEFGGFTLNLGATLYTNNTNALIGLKQCRNSRVSDIILNGNIANQTSATGLRVLECWDSVIQNIECNDILNLGISGRRGYGVYLEASRGVICNRLTGTRTKHLFDCDKANWQFIARDLVYEYCDYGIQIGGSNQRPFSTHGGADGVVIRHCKHQFLDADGANLGFIVRSANTILENNEIDAVINNSYVSSPFFIGENITNSGADAVGASSQNGDGISALGLKIRNNNISIIRDLGDFSSINDGYFIHLKTSAQDVEIKNNILLGLHRTAIFFEGNNNSEITIQNNDIEFRGHLVGQKIIYISPQFGSDLAENVSFIKNTVKNSRTPIAVDGSIDNATYINLDNNITTIL